MRQDHTSQNIQNSFFAKWIGFVFTVQLFSNEPYNILHMSHCVIMWIGFVFVHCCVFMGGEWPQWNGGANKSQNKKARQGSAFSFIFIFRWNANALERSKVMEKIPVGSVWKLASLIRYVNWVRNSIRWMRWWGGWVLPLLVLVGVLVLALILPVGTGKGTGNGIDNW